MESGSNKSLFTLIAVVVFGIFLSLSYFLFQDEMKSVLADVIGNTSQMTSEKLNTNGYRYTESKYFTFDASSGTLTDYDMSGGTDVVIPPEINGVAVVAIADNTFCEKGLTSVVIPDSVKLLGDTSYGSGTSTYRGPFAYNPNLISVIIGDGVTLVGNSCFFACPKLMYVDFGNSVTTIGADSFMGASFTSIEFPNSLNSIHYAAFKNTKLESLTLPDSVITLGNDSFANCNIRSLNLGSKLKNIGQATFAYNKITDLVIPNSVTSVGSCFIFGNPLKTLNISSDLKDEILTNVHILAKTGICQVGGSTFIGDTFYGSPIVNYY